MAFQATTLPLSYFSCVKSFIGLEPILLLLWAIRSNQFKLKTLNAWVELNHQFYAYQAYTLTIKLQAFIIILSMEIEST